MALLLKSGKQILRLSSAKYQHLGISVVGRHFIKDSYLGADHNSTNNKQKQDNDFELPPKTWKSFFTSFFKSPASLITPFQELVGRFVDMAEESKDCSEDRLPLVLDNIRPLLIELIWRFKDESIVKLVYELARPAASPSSPPPIVIDEKVKAIVDKLPPHVIHLCQDIMVGMFRRKYADGSTFDIDLQPNTIVITANVSRIRKDHLKLFVVDDFLMVTGIAKDAPPRHPLVLPLIATIHQMINMPTCPYSYNDVTASILEDPGRGSQLKVVVPCLKGVVVNKPRVYQLNLDTHQG